MVRDVGQLDRDYLSKNNCDCLKGIFAIFVLSHHLYQHSGLLHGNIFGVIFAAMGYLSVAVFFFLSGYGLMISYQKNGAAYVRQMPKKRILPFYCLILLLTLFYTIIVCVLLKEYVLTPFMIIKSLTIGGTVIGNGWYLQVQLLLYILFYVIYSIERNSKLQISLIATFVIVYCVIAYVLGLGSFWYKSVLAFILGLLWGIAKQKIDLYFSNKKKIFFVAFASFIVFCITFIGARLLNTKATILLEMASSVFFSLLVILLSNFVKVDYGVTRFLGKISLEIYVFQGLFLSLFHSRIISITNPYVYVVVVAFCTVIFAYMINPFIKWIYKSVGGIQIWKKNSI